MALRKRICPKCKSDRTELASGFSGTAVGSLENTQYRATFKCLDCGNEWREYVPELFRGGKKKS